MLKDTVSRLVRATPREVRNNAIKPYSRVANYLGYQSPPFAPTPTTLEAQGVFIRCIAWLIDSALLGILTFAVFVPVTFGVFVTGAPLPAISDSALIWMELLIALLVQFVYFTALEGTYGQTLGKFVSELKIVNEDGSRVGYKAAALRTTLRLIDFLPVLYVVGVLLIWSSERRQRLGDRIAHTIVISHVRYTSV